MKKILLILAALLIIGVIIFTVMANQKSPGNEENYIGDGINATAVPDRILTSNVIYWPFDKTYVKQNDFSKFDYITIDFDISPDGKNGTYHVSP